jgi:hypothetical protein
MLCQFMHAEHLLSLVFLGSEKYPHKGIIDHLANRGFSNGTNAWTDTDHTAYTVSTAGEQGFLQLLPIYVDHILYPTITDAGYVTEVRFASLRTNFREALTHHRYTTSTRRATTQAWYTRRCRAARTRLAT